MKNFFLALALSMLNVGLCLGQQIKYDIRPDITIRGTKYAKLFKKTNETEECNDQKSGSVIDKNKLSSCFRLVKTISSTDSRKIVGILRSKGTYGFLKYDCFSTDYAIVLFSKSDAVIGYVNFSFTCGNLYSNPVIDEQKSLSPKNYSLVGFSKNGKSQLLKILRLSKLNLNKDSNSNLTQ
ncbi:hypothetical protein [Mucilaginibacter sp. OK098]|uniref:hypothetical protein n=1 Tax=Mucilaginibacter sp. OK098 TaxID=1855297 RepID=UPI00091AE371|nr:hypothetical protein [Mucilaginibacter sp. OK098]SHM67396.1 hypothetical protein SAMN05216524_1035 [Mucilaginibacter sp. OK098]